MSNPYGEPGSPAAGDETGFEAFYDAEHHPGINLTADIEYVGPSFGSGPLVTETPDDV